MLISAGSDFLALCREQIALLTQGLGASFSVVYLTEEIVETPTQESRLIPVVVYPETLLLQYGDDANNVKMTQPIAMDDIFSVTNQEKNLLVPTWVYTDKQGKGSERRERNLWDNWDNLQDYQVVSPLIYEGVMMGLLVTGREDRSWNEKEEEEIKRIAKTLAIACILEQRSVWWQQQLQQEKVLQSQQRDLLDNLLHQFRNPLTAIRTFGKLLLKRFIPTDKNREVASSIVHESDRLQELLQQFDQVIDLTTSEVIITANVDNEGKSTLLLPGTGDQLTNCQIADIIKPLLISAQAIAQEKNLQLITDIPHNLPLVKVNEKALQEVLNNIIDNALKYTPDGGKILIAIGEEKDHFQGIIISDSGYGIPPEDLARLGERYYRGNKSQTTIPGTGLGISIAKQLIAEMHGTLEIFSPAIKPLNSSSEYPGTTVIVWLLEDN
ncbi:HAMP domain-containing histidine kinase [Anabaena sp. FACHB-1237]|uniref:sensor histidine kinase n=1 Tax=Anabaena sp. FACHB-1237 TaxID=2692769 RepID=UPI00167FF1D3|nr:HAMP domain-containing sensor histidine kinase [Anabaena sp. FACHB-1237]MBD2139752.1 HAMP domain-containing histidine kinase [Anabaena sp. FACHB-1237]